MAVKTVTFAFKGSSQNWVVPANLQGGTCTVTVKGAGGNSQAGGGVVGVLAVTPGETLAIDIGGVGKVAPSNTVAGAGGWPNGGPGGRTSGSGAVSGNGGSGASQIRRGSTRLVVAAGAGGNGRNGSGTGTGGAGGKGGAATGQNGASGSGTGTANGTGGIGGTAAAGGAGGSASGGAGTAAGQGGTGGGSSAVNTRGGGGGGGGSTGGGGGGASSVNRGSGGGGGGTNSTSGLQSVTSNTQGGGSAANTNGVISITYTTPPLRPAVIPPNYGYDGGTYTSMPIGLQWADSDSPPAQISTSDVQYRKVGATAWTQIMGITSPAPYQYQGAYIFAAGTFTVGDYEVQVRLHDTAGNVGAWSDSLVFTALAPPAAAYPYVDLPNQWPNQFTSEVDMRARIDRNVNALSRWVAHPADTDSGDPTRRASIGVEVSFTATKGGQTVPGAFGQISVAAGAVFLFDNVIQHGDGYPIYDMKTGLVTIPQPGLYLVGGTVIGGSNSAVGAAVAYIDGLVAAGMNQPGARLRNPPLFGVDIGPVAVRLVGGEQISMRIDRATTISTDSPDYIEATRLYVWRIGA